MTQDKILKLVDDTDKILKLVVVFIKSCELPGKSVAIRESRGR